ncbi:MAG: short chain dehydrogenase [Moraxellaceae bacterium]|nr:short chain dehydrogenase [Moraxellaceae bacterium]
MTRVLITGAASGLGRALALAWARRGARVLVADINAERGAESVQLCMAAGATEAAYLHLDVTQERDFDSAMAWVRQHWGGLDVMVNNAGVAGGGSFEGIPDEDWHWLLEINLMGVVRGCRAATKLFKAQESGAFVNIASMAGLLNPPAMASYNVAKAGVVALSETLAAELAPWNIATLAVCPSYFQTNLNESLRTRDAAMQAALPKLLAGSELSADDIAEGILDALARGEALYLPHPRARAAWQQKLQEPAAFRAEMQAQARKLAGRR